MRIQKYLAANSKHSRRTIERMVEEGKVWINGNVAKLGQVIKHGDILLLDKKSIKVDLEKEKEDEVLILNKPLGVICSKKDNENRQTVYSLLPNDNEKWFMVGRLDINTSGLIIFCNNGEFANQLMHPRYSLIRTYRVRVYGKSNEPDAKKLEKGIDYDGKLLRCHLCQPLGRRDGMNQWYEMKLKSGHNRMIRKMWESLGMQVSKLIRIGYANIDLPENLALGKTERLTRKEIEKLKQHWKKENK